MAFADFTAKYTKDEYPDEFTVVSVGPFAAAALANGDYTLFVTDRICTLDSVTVCADTAGTAGTMMLTVAPSGTAIGSGTDISAANDTTGLTAATVKAFTLLEPQAYTNMAAGTKIGITTASNIATLAGCVFTIRVRTRDYRTTTSGSRQWVHPPVPPAT